MHRNGGGHARGEVQHAYALLQADLESGEGSFIAPCGEISWTQQDLHLPALPGRSGRRVGSDATLESPKLDRDLMISVRHRRAAHAAQHRE